MSRYKVYVTDTVDGRMDEYEGDGVFLNTTDKKSSNGKFCCDGMNGIEMGAWMHAVEDQVNEVYENHPDVKLAVVLSDMLAEIMDNEKEEGED